MLYQSENTNIDKNLWNEEEIRDLILYAKDLQVQNEDLRAKMIAMNAKLENEEKKTKRLQNILNLLAYGKRD